MEATRPVFINSSHPLAKGNVALHELCDACKPIAEELGRTTPPPHQPVRWVRHPFYDELRHLSLPEIEESAEFGCHLCSLIANRWRNRKPPTSQSKDFHEWDPHRPTLDKFMLRLYANRQDSFGFMRLVVDGYGIGKFKEQVVIMDYAQTRTTIKTEDYKKLDELARASEASTTTAGEATFTLAKFWLDSCLEKHVKCRRAQQPRNSEQLKSPARLLFLGTAGLVRTVLVPSRRTRQRQVPPYLTLSHCWGGTSILKLTTMTKNDLARGLTLSRLPKTFRDAVEITLRLGYEHLWIDSLCIVQDSAEDWAQQSAIMGQIYRGAVCTIAAAASSNSLEGCFVQGSPLSHRDCQLALGPGRAVFACGGRADGELQHRPLKTRAWVLQEDLLSPRTLAFCDSGIEWSCLERHTDENACWQRLAYEDRVKDVETPKMDFNDLCLKYINILSIDAKHYPSFHSRWWDLVASYSKLDLTFTSDKLPAVNGIIEMLSSYTGLEAVAGLWRQMLPHDLLWIAGASRYKRHDCVRPAEYWRRAPSWSWASIDGPVGFVLIPSSTYQFGRDAEEYSTDRTAVAEVQDIAAPRAIQQHGAGAAFVRGSIRLSTPLHRCKWLACRAKRPYSRGGGGTWWYGDDSSVSLWNKDVWLALILRTKETKGDHCCDMLIDNGVKRVIDEGLVLMPTDKQQRGFEFERVGAFSQQYWEDEAQEPFVFFQQDGSIRVDIVVL